MDCVIVGQGLVSPLALGVVEHVLFVRASVEAAPPPPFETADGERVRTKHCGFLGTSLDMAERLSRMSEIAAHQALAPWEALGQTHSLALAFIAPRRRGIEAQAISATRSRLAKRCGAAMTQTWQDSACAFEALKQAHSWLSRRDVSAVLIVGVDSFVHPAALEDDIVARESPFLPDAPPPSEAAAAILVTREELCREYGLEGARIRASDTALGRGNDDDEALLDGIAMTSLLRGLPEQRIDLVVGQENVSDLRARDWAMASARLARRFHQELQAITLESEIGRIGAAAGIANLAFGTAILRHGMFRDLSPTAHFVAWAISGDGTRGLALVQGGAGKRRPLVFMAAHDGPAIRSVERPPFQISEATPEPAAEGAAPDIDAGPLSPPLDILGASNDNEAPPPVRGPTDHASVRLGKGKGAPLPLLSSYAEIVAACLDGLALCARHRALLPREGRAREEERILAFLDALVVTPRFPALLVAWWEEAVELPDPWKAWAPTFVLASLEGADVPEALADLWRRLPEDDVDACVCAGEALAVGSNPERQRWARTLARDAHPAVRASSYRSLFLMDALGPDEIARLLEEDADYVVRWVALHAAARFPEDRKLTALLRAELQSTEDRELAWRSARSLLIQGQSIPYDELRRDPELLRRIGPYALDILAWVGHATDADLARQAVARLGLTSSVLRGLGRYGHPGAAPLLLRALGDEDTAEEAASALFWMFGMPFEERKLDSADRWRAFLRAAPLDESTRYRFGEPYRPGGIAQAISEGRCSQAELAWLVDEANVRAGLSERPPLFRWSTEADPALAKSVESFRRRDEAFLADSWRSSLRPTGRRS